VAGPNVFDPSFEPDEEVSGFLRRRSVVGRDAGADRLGATLRELPPGRTATPYHFHYANEEMLVVVAGRPSLRTPEGWRELAPGEVVAFPIGERGAHQVANFSAEPCRYLLISEKVEPEVCVYPDSGKVGFWEKENNRGEDGHHEIHRSADAVDYWEGERPPAGP
jgi:uncharacterized cupin superfamily protein